MKWMTVQDFPNYEVAENGYVRNKITGRFKMTTLKNGYYYVTFYDGKTKTTKGVHSLVLETFKGKPFGAKKIRHKDSDKKNNHIDNLEWDMPDYQLPEKVLRMVKEAITKGLMTQKEVSELYDIPQNNL